MATTCDKSILNRLKRAEGQLRGIQKMIEEGTECGDVITQLSAVRSSVDRVMGLIVAENLKSCLENPAADTEVQHQKIEQAVNMIVKK
ncbi:metal-sensitive transcriptional regulator [Enterococcus asini]|uniref:Metal-sensitive transcriptional regulator n=1 Tax=Enterococcus asini TaxID=57732 RepID=A0AAW8TWT7_9ENTE|nr:metal-sensitive transcriptional regulator [Enterococcus asini]MDT2810493.1 metal-sensitive transcriptional regulator [Enterococcus asini]